MAKKAVAAALFVALLLLPALGPFYTLFATEILIFCLFAISFNLLFGYTGLLSFGHAAFFGLGGYTAALMAYHTHLSLIPILVASTTVAAIGAAIIGFLCIRRDEIYFAMLTLGFGMMVFTLVHQWRSLTGGSDGITGFEVPPLSLLGIKLSLFSPSNFYYLTLFFVLLLSLILATITRSPFGLVLKSIRENPERASFVGINVAFYRWMSFTISGAITGVAGALFALYDRMASPTMVHWSMSAKPVLMTILGGSKVFAGPAIGALVFYLLEHIITQYTESWMIFLGAMLIPIVMFFPDGIAGTALKILKGKGSGQK